MTIVQSQLPTRAPAWAVLERQLFDAMDQAAPIFIDKYTRPGGSLVWTESYPGDGVWADSIEVLGDHGADPAELWAVERLEVGAVLLDDLEHRQVLQGLERRRGVGVRDLPLDRLQGVVRHDVCANRPKINPLASRPQHNRRI